MCLRRSFNRGSGLEFTPCALNPDQAVDSQLKVTQTPSISIGRNCQSPETSIRKAGTTQTPSRQEPLHQAWQQ